MREAVERWAIKRAVNVMRALLAREPTPERFRRLLALAAPLLARRESFDASVPFAIGDAGARWIRPAGSASGAVILYLHGGGFVASAPTLYESFVAALSREAGGRGLMLDYRLAPEHPFPAALEDCFAAWEFLLSSGVDPARIVIAGDSAGGNLVVNTAMRARDEGLPQPAALLLISPLLDLTFSGESVRRNDGFDPMFRAASLHRLLDYYGTGLDPREPRLSPLFGRLTGLPPAMVLAGSSEVLLDDALRFAARVPGARTAVWHDLPHVFPVFRGLTAGDRAIREMADFIRARTADATAGTA
ncbi:MAG: alpha/beta hydrolase [Steroidobacteraceae bacterium]|nr:alpha/beta hydrolase [Steroidobacteraceae bacterium]